MSNKTYSNQIERKTLPLQEADEKRAITTSNKAYTKSEFRDNLNSISTKDIDNSLYTEEYAKEYIVNPIKAIAPFVSAANKANELNMEINAGHDLDLNNLNYFSKNINKLKEVSIGHALISDALTFGMETTIHKYLNEINRI